jgi:hypothetical protein
MAGVFKLKLCQPASEHGLNARQDLHGTRITTHFEIINPSPRLDE